MWILTIHSTSQEQFQEIPCSFNSIQELPIGYPCLRVKVYVIVKRNYLQNPLKRNVSVTQLFTISYDLYCSQFDNLHVNTTAIHKENKDLMLDMLSQHQNWYIQKELCLIHSKFPIVIEAMITVCFLSLLFK